ncbi:hypothetical protein [Collimonas fungivorans]|nr:hypothetical protein [Collimonas fungivorans]
MSDTIGFRRTALLLHAMSAADRDWMLAKLDGEMRATLKTMLDELLALGIPADRALLNRAADGIVPAASTRRHSDASVNIELNGSANILRADAVDSAIANLADMGPAALSQILNEEPAELIARLLACHDWKWRDGLLEKLGSGRRLQVERLAHSFSACPPRLREVLLQSVAARVAQLPIPVQGQKQPHAANNGLVGQSTGLVKKMVTSFKLHRQFSSVKRSAR